MKFAVLSDIHSNHIALEACMDKIDCLGADGVIFLGDYVTDCPFPRKTMELLYQTQEKYPTWFIRGNREDYLLGHMRAPNDGWHYCSQSGSLLYTFEELNGSDLRFFESMPVSMVISPDGVPPFSICHATLSDNKRIFYPDSPDLAEIFAEQTTELTVCGHTHSPFVISQDSKRIVNAGCVTAKTAHMLILTSDGEDWQTEFLKVPYDTERLIAEFSESGLLEKGNGWARGIIGTLRGMGDMDLKLVELVGKKCRERSLPFDDETLWQESAAELGI